MCLLKKKKKKKKKNFASTIRAAKVLLNHKSFAFSELCKRFSIAATADA